MSDVSLADRGWMAGPAGPGHAPWLATVLHQAIRMTGLLGYRASSPRRDARAADERPSFEASALPHLDAAYNLARYLSRDPDAAEDIVQEAFLRAFRAWPEFRGGNVRAWLFAIVRNCHLSWRDQRRRHEARASARPSDPDEGDDDPLLRVAAEGDPECDMLRSEEAATVRRTLDGLSDEMREILVLRDLEECTYRDIAEILGVPMGTVMSRLSRARRTFASHWNRRAGEAPHE